MTGRNSLRGRRRFDKRSASENHILNGKRVKFSDTFTVRNYTPFTPDKIRGIQWRKHCSTFHRQHKPRALPEERYTIM